MMFKVTGPGGTIEEIEMDTWELWILLKKTNWGPVLSATPKITIRGRYAGNEKFKLTLKDYEEDFRGKRPKEKR